MELRQLAPGVYACLQEDRGLGFSNSGLVAASDGLVIDTFWDLPHTRQMLDEYARVLPEAPGRVVNTHHNGDHCWGNQLLPDAEIVAHALCAQEMARAESPEIMQMLREAAGGDDPAMAAFGRGLAEWDFTGVEIRLPTRTFEGPVLDLDLDGHLVRLIHVGPAHTPGDTIVHIPEHGVVFAGDVLFRLCTPIGWAGTYDRWLGALDEIVALEPQVIVPGHGPVCGVEGPKEMKAYLEYVRAESREHFEAGRTVSEAVMRIDLGPYEGWTEPQRLVFNVDRAYRELRGDAWDAPVDAVSMMRAMYDLTVHWAAGVG